MENVWIILLFGIALGTGIQVGKGIISILNRCFDISIDYIIDKFAYKDDEEDEQNWN